jgi:hypothetical protein
MQPTTPPSAIIVTRDAVPAFVRAYADKLGKRFLPTDGYAIGVGLDWSSKDATWVVRVRRGFLAGFAVRVGAPLNAPAAVSGAVVWESPIERIVHWLGGAAAVVASMVFLKLIGVLDGTSTGVVGWLALPVSLPVGIVVWGIAKRVADATSARADNPFPPKLLEEIRLDLASSLVGDSAR